MIDFIPLEIYAKIFFNFLLFVSFVVFMQSFGLSVHAEGNLKTKGIFGGIIMLLSIVYIGLRPVSGEFFGDMARYAANFNLYANGGKLQLENDIFFQVFTKFWSLLLTVDLFFVLCAFLYIFPLYFVSKKFFGPYWFYAFLMFVLSFTFWGSAVNGIRNGIATSIFLFAFSFNLKYKQYLWMFLALLFHKSIMIPTAAYIFAFLHRDSKNYLRFWFLAIPLSLVLGGFFQNFFLGFGFGEEERIEGYFTELDEGIQNAKLGFRWDFIVYSFTGVFAGWYYIYKKKYKDILYSQLYNMYLLANAFWILVIRANFSNRFAYLSWFMLPLIIIYPLLKTQIFNKQHQMIGKIVLGYYLFTYLLNVILT
jgi:uncharacterized membrane protein